MGSALTLGAGFLGAGAAVGEAEAAELEAKFESNRIKFNKKVAEINAEDAIKRGDEQVADFKKQAARMQGSQRAALAAQGIAVDSGTAEAIQYETAKQIDTDIHRIKNNAWREAWGYKVEATSLGTQARMTQLAGQNRAQTLLAEGGFRFASSIASSLEQAGAFKGKKG